MNALTAAVPFIVHSSFPSFSACRTGAMVAVLRQGVSPWQQRRTYKKPAHDTTVVAGFTSCSPQPG
jgi:hypothetical protein